MLQQVRGTGLRSADSGFLCYSPSRSGRSSGLGSAILSKVKGLAQTATGCAREEAQQWGEEDFPRSQARVALAGRAALPKGESRR